ncbi:NgoMIV family type II restriction endonuclease [Clavibacter nebraskensis]|uniref:Restriction endonuclease n=1 Tax=Clavibacter nebraskensis TaxID=31963 RepID=A0A399QKI8_9MICO|nr:NgoMIV family type II restriction endonuclease [Clavibacter nebraskensis]QGV67061.1 restriction endonuclease [Clavibacter nebraskensis]RIJ17707.1 restriction endonuclease [Clavibacter nebraskensis]UKF29340.1 restriction endonuclease [Clavibacter nebraskensis]
MDSEALFADARRQYHASLLEGGTLNVSSTGVPSNADKSNATSVKYAKRVAASLRVETVGERHAGQSSGNEFEAATALFIQNAFTRLSALRPGNWEIRQVSDRGRAAQASVFEQYAHLSALDSAIKANPALLAVLGNGYAIAPDIVVSRAPVSDEEINTEAYLIDDSVSRLTSMRSSNQTLRLLHAVISCKWTIRSDRAQNSRSEALNLIRNRKGRLPHISVVTAEPLPSRLSSIALGTGDIDCVYHFALPELLAAVEAEQHGDAIESIRMMIEGNRLKDISDLPLDLAF